LRLLELRLKNFKGQKDFALTPDGNDISIYAANGVGKTTIADAFSWLLFGVDTANRTDHKIKTEDKSGEALHGLEHSVEAVLDAVTLKRTYKEKWTKKRGGADKQFEGHETEYHIDGVPVSKREYDDRITSICDQSTFKLLTNPRYFQGLKKEDRRSMLLAVCGDISDADIIASDEKLARLPEVLGPRTIDDHKKVATERKRRINDELKAIPSRIDEVELGLPDVSEIDQTKLDGQLIKLTGEKQSREKELVRIQSGGEIAAQNKKLAEIDRQIIEIKNAHSEASGDVVAAKRRELMTAQSGMDAVVADIDRLVRRVANNNDELADYGKKRAALITEWEEIKARTFVPSAADICPACSQPLPQEKVEAANALALAAHNKAKSDALEANTEAGKALKVKREAIEADSVKLAQEIDALKATVEKQRAIAGQLKSEIEAIPSVPLFEESVEYKAAQAAKAEIKEAIAGLEQDQRGVIAKVESEIDSTERQIEKVNADLAKFKARTTGAERIEELKAQEKELAKEYEQLEADLFLIEEFTRAKCELLTDKINSQFELARFKLFEEQVNGGIKDICEVTHLWNPPSNAQEINVGLDIIRTFARFYGVCPPIFVDNSESINQLIDMPGQVVRLVVSMDKALRIETEPEKLREAV